MSAVEEFAVGIQGVAVGDVADLIAHVVQSGGGYFNIALAHDEDCPQRYGFSQCRCSEVDILFDAADEDVPRIEAALISFGAEAVEQS